MFQCSSASRKFLNWTNHSRRSAHGTSFSALQRAENSSISADYSHPEHSHCVSVLFSEPKIPQYCVVFRMHGYDQTFQCSSASRKFLNPSDNRLPVGRRVFQCSSASRKFLNFVAKYFNITLFPVSVLFSEPKIPQSNLLSRASRNLCVSVLFSEPKIPQSFSMPTFALRFESFSALQRAENSSMWTCADA